MVEENPLSKCDNQLTDGALVRARIVDLVVADGLGPVHSLVEHLQLHLLLLNQLLSVACVHAIGVLLRLVIFVLALNAKLVVLGLDHGGARAILEVALLLVRLDGDVGIDAVVVFLLLGKHTLSLAFDFKGAAWSTLWFCTLATSNNGLNSN